MLSKKKISVPAAIHFKILSLIAWHYYDNTTRFIQSVPRLDYAASENWAMECRRELLTVELRPKLSLQPQLQEAREEEGEFFRGSPNLKALKVQLRLHSGMSAELLRTPGPEGCRILYDRLGIRELTWPEPADWSIRHTSEARCKVCQIYEHDLMERQDRYERHAFFHEEVDLTGGHGRTAAGGRRKC